MTSARCAGAVGEFARALAPSPPRTAAGTLQQELQQHVAVARQLKDAARTEDKASPGEYIYIYTYMYMYMYMYMCTYIHIYILQ